MCLNSYGEDTHTRAYFSSKEYKEYKTVLNALDKTTERSIASERE